MERNRILEGIYFAAVGWVVGFGRLPDRGLFAL
jgi:hypothetical protein